MVQTQTAVLCDSLIGGRYQIIESIGQGGMAQVYLAIDQKTGENVAIKVMHDDLANDPVLIKCFEAEARVTSSLNHPNIVRVVGFGQDHERRYIVQEYVEGGSLKELINKGGAIPWQTAVLMAIQIARALEYAHEKGIVHSDIKPHNILITQEQLAKVTDFGIAQTMTSNAITMTSGISFGSVHYASPEQIRGSIMSEKSDIYSLGILIYEMVTGRVPFDCDTSVAIAIKHLQELPPSSSLIIRTIPHGLDQIIMKCIQKSPENRYQNARELVDELDAILIDPNGDYGNVAGLPNLDRQTTALQLIGTEPNYNKLREIEQIIIERKNSRRRDTAIVMAIILVAIVFLTSVGTWGWSKLSDSIQTEPNQSYELSNYIGRELTEVLGILKKDNILTEVVYSVNPTVIVGLITAQTPSSGVMINKTNTKLTLTVSSGPEQQVIPDLSGQSAVKAQTELSQSMGYKVTIVVENAQIDQGMVIRTIPEAGQRVPRGDSIVLVVSSGLPLVTMPNFVGKSLTNAHSEIITLRLVLGPVFSISGAATEAKQIIIRQSVPAGTKIMEQSVISFTYGTAQDYANFRNPTPTPVPFIMMPDLDRMSLVSVRTLLTLQGLPDITLSYLSAESLLLPESQLYVIEQFPVAGTQILLSDSVRILAGSMVEYEAFKNPVLTPELTPTPTSTPLPTPTPSLAPTAAPLPTPAPSPVPTAAPLPTPTPILAPAPAPTIEPTTTVIPSQNPT